MTLTDKAIKKALIYCRVSDPSQDIGADGLGSQEHRCRQYAAERGYTVDDDALFTDKKTGGGDFMSRPGMVALIRYLKKNRHTSYVVIFDDLKRFARDTEFYLNLRRTLASHGATVECPNFKFEDTPEGKFFETIVAAHGELERVQIGRQTRQKTKARLERGFWTFQAPIGYKFTKAEKEMGSGKILVPHEPLASIMREALEGYASGRFQLQSEVQSFLHAQPEYPKSQDKCKVTRHLQQVAYAGYVEYKPWGVSLRKGQHQPLISLETYQKIQDLLAGKARAPQRKNLAEEFPLRGFVTCGECGFSLTSCFSRGRNGYHAYYLCHSRSCPSYGKSIRRDVMESDFEALLTEMQPSKEVFEGACLMFEQVWDHQVEIQRDRTRSLKVEVAKIDREVERYVDRIVDAANPTVIQALEKRITDLQLEKALAAEKIANCGRPLHDFDETLRTALSFIANPCKLWRSEHYEDKRTVLKLAFDQQLAYERNKGFRTANVTLPFKMLADFSVAKNQMVPEVGIEPTRF